MVKLPGAGTEGGREPAIRPLPFLTWVFYRTVSKIEGPQYMRSPCRVLCSGSGASPLSAYAQVIAAPSSASPPWLSRIGPSVQRGEMRKEISSHLDLLMKGDHFLALEPSRVLILNLPLRHFFAVTLIIQDSVYGANYMSPHTISLSLAKYRKINSSHGLEMPWHRWVTVTQLGYSAPTPHIYPSSLTIGTRHTAWCFLWLI